MLAVGHEPADERETFEVELLRREQRISDEVRDDAPDEIVESPRLPLERPIAAIGPDASAPEVRLQRMQYLGAISVLADGEAGPHLPSHEQLRSRRDGDGEAAFSVGIPGDIRREELATAPGAGV